MLSTLSFLELAIEKRKQEKVLRQLPAAKNGIDFYSNDYLGFSTESGLTEIVVNEIIQQPDLLKGATGSRLISGNSDRTMQVESFLAHKHQVQSALLFPSGYTANLAFFSSVPQRGDTILMDECIHRSVRDGVRLSDAHKIKFRHNDMQHLEELLKRSRGNCFIAVESLYSMDGDFAPLHALTLIAKRYNANLVVDEAHAFGIFGYGLVSQKKLQHRVFATMITYGKALGLHGAAILGTELLISFLINFSSAFIYTTGSSDLYAISIQKGYEFLKENPERIQDLQNNILLLRNSGLPFSSASESPIQILRGTTISCVKNLQQQLEKEGFLTFAALAPTVKKGEERLRICLHSYNSSDEINQLSDLIKKHL